MPPQASTDSGSNGHTSLQDLFALTDEQILEIPEEVASDPSRNPLRAGEWPFDNSQGKRGASEDELDPPSAPAREERKSAGNEREDNSRAESQVTTQESRTTDNGSRNTAHDSPQPPKWLADRMADPQAGREARELWDGVQRAREESSAYRETFATPADARAAAERAKLLENIDRAYYTGDSGERTRLAETMLRENPAAFREMVEAGLKLLQQDTGSQHGAKSLGTAFQHPEHNQVSSNAAPPFRAASSQADNPAGQNNVGLKADASTAQSGHAHEAQLAAYAAFERSANEDLERSVGSAITRTLEQALPNSARMQTSGQTGAQPTAPIQERLATAVRQDVETALRGDQQLGEQVLQILSSRRFDAETRAQVVRLIADRAQQLIPGATKRVLSEWTQTTLAAHRGRNERSQSASARRDLDPISSAPGKVPSNRQTPSHQKAPNASHKVNYHSLSDEQILDL